MTDKSMSADGARSAILGHFIVLETLRKAAWIKQGEWALERDQYAQGGDIEKGMALIVQDAIQHLRGLRLEWDRQNGELKNLVDSMFPPDARWSPWSPYDADDPFDPDEGLCMAAYLEEAQQRGINLDKLMR